MIIPEIDISNMKEDVTYKSCPYCGFPEPKNPENVFWNYYQVNKKKYPFEANIKGYDEEYSNTHYGVCMSWNEIHCCKKCKKEYYTYHEH